MRPLALLACSILVPLAGCGDDGVGGAGGAGGGGATSSGAGGHGAEGGSGGAGPASLCRGTLLDRGDAQPTDDGRGTVVSCGDVEVRVLAHGHGVMRLTYDRSDAEPSGRPSYAVVGEPDQQLAVAIGADATTVRVCTDELLVEIDRATCGARALDEDGNVVSEDRDGGGLVVGGELGPSSRGLVRTAAPGERFYGFGERTGTLDKRGQKMTFWNTDAYQAAFGGYPPDADPLYQSIPFFIGLRDARAYGVLLDNTHRLSFDMGASDPDAYALYAAEGPLDVWLLAGPSMSEVTARYARLTGAITMPPRWSLGYHQSRWGYYPASAVLDVASELRARRIPADALWLDIQHMDGFRSFTWDPVGFSDPQGLASALSSQGFHSVAIIDPGIKVDPAWDVYTTMRDEGLFLEQGGSPYVGEVWPGPASFPDFTSPAARTYWSSLVPRITDAGVAGLWIDMNEPSDFVGPGGTVPDDLAAAGDGAPSTMAELHNVYALQEARATYEGLLDARPGERPFVLSRAGYAGIQRYAAVWTGDAPSTWPTLETTLPMLLGMGLSGVPFVGSDVGGYSGSPGPELYARWMQLGSVSPFFRSHAVDTAPPQEPWQLGTEVLDISRQSIERRYALMPTLYSLFDEARRNGAPVLRPLVFEHQSDEATHAIDDQAMLGPSLMIAPVLSSGATSRTVYFPPGRWFEERSGAIYEGPSTETIGVKLGALPTFAREGAIIAKGPAVQHTDEAPLSPLGLDIYPGDSPTSFVLYEDDGHSTDYLTGGYLRTTLTLEPTPTGAALRVSDREGSYTPPSRTVVVRARRADAGVDEVRLDGDPLPAFPTVAEAIESGHGYAWDAADLSIVVAFEDTGAFELALDYDRTIDELRPPVPMTFHVALPAGTPTTTPIHVASSATNWTHQPLTFGPTMQDATGTILVPRGEWIEYKYTRGDWTTVEKWPGCVEATNRYELGAAHPVKEDTVFGWADQCN